MVVRYFLAVQNLFHIRIEHDILLKQQGIKNRFDHISRCPLHVIGKILAVCSRICHQLFLIKALRIFQRLLCGKPK